MGIGIEEILEAIVHRIPAPEKPKDETLRALVFDSVFDVYRGVIGHVRVVSGKMEPGQAIRMMSNDGRYEIKEAGVFTPKMLVQPRLSAGASPSCWRRRRRRSARGSVRWRRCWPIWGLDLRVMPTLPGSAPAAPPKRRRNARAMVRGRCEMTA